MFLVHTSEDNVMWGRGGVDKWDGDGSACDGLVVLGWKILQMYGRDLVGLENVGTA